MSSDLDRHIDALVARAPRMTAEQADLIRRIIGPDFYRPSGKRWPQRDPREDAVVYYVERNGLIKIGTSYEVERRALVLKGQLLATEPGSYRLEAERHRQFADARAGRTEWFCPTPALREHIATLAPDPR